MLAIHDNYPVKIGKIVLFVFGILSIALYLYTVIAYALNYPFWDDYDAILKFMNNFVQSDVKAKFTLFYEQHNEHRILFNKLIILLQFYLFKNTNFYYLVLVGNIGWILLIVLLSKYLISKGWSIIFCVPLWILMSTFAHYESMTWAMCSLQQYYQLFFAITAIYYLTNNHIIRAEIFAICSIFAGGGGLALIPIFLLHIVLKYSTKRILLYIIPITVALVCYFIDYNMPPKQLDIWLFITNPLDFLEYIFCFMGGIGKSLYQSLFIGITLSCLFLWNSKLMYKSYPFIFWSVVYIVLVASITTVSRIDLGVDSALSSRYKIYPLLLLSLLFILFAININNKRILFISAVISIIIFNYWYPTGILNIEARNEQLSRELCYPNYNHAIDTLRKSEKLSVYSYWKNLPIYTDSSKE